MNGIDRVGGPLLSDIPVANTFPPFLGKSNVATGEVHTASNLALEHSSSIENRC